MIRSLSNRHLLSLSNTIPYSCNNIQRSHKLSSCTTSTSSPSVQSQKKNIIGMSKEELFAECSNLKVEQYRAKQVWGWLYARGATSFAAMNNLSKKQQQLFDEHFTIFPGDVTLDSTSNDGTRKFLVNFKPDEVECVYIPESDRGTLCVSSQVGCTQACKFCHTGTQKLVRNLTAGEIVSQLYIARNLLGDQKTAGPERRKITNLVFMGQGEPFYNYRNLSKAITILTDQDGLCMSKHRITVSTSGVVPMIEKLGNEFPGIGLAISLHAVTDTLRSHIVPINQQWGIAELMATVKKFPGVSWHNKVTIEYVMLKGVNDSLADAKGLVSLLKGFPFYVNLIPFNPWPGAPFECSSNNTIHKFAAFVEDAGVKTVIRQTRGDDILAACGQLKTMSLKAKKIIPSFESSITATPQFAVA